MHLGSRLEAANETVDSIVSRYPPAEEGSIRSLSNETELRILKVFPYIVVASVIMWLAVLVINGDYSFGYMIMDLCLVFVFVFTLIGMALLPFMHRGPFPMPFVVAVAVVLAALQFIVGSLAGIETYTVTVGKILGALGIHLDDWLLSTVTLVSIFFVTFFTTLGVLSITVSYLRVELAKVFLAMEKHAVNGERGKAEKFFQVPDIIDVKEVVLEPEIDTHTFDLKLMLDMAKYNVIFGIIVSSYLFINPLFLETVDLKVLLSMMVLLSMFMPVLVISWISMRTVGAKVLSDAPRPFELWTGAKNKLLGSFIALGAFAVMLWLSLYYGHSILDIISLYASFSIPLIFISLMYSFMFVNNFGESLKVSVLRRFIEGKKEIKGLERRGFAICWLSSCPLSASSGAW